VGEKAYIRWMDDQNVGVKSRIQARSVVHLMVESLCSQRLTFNSGKTRVLNPKQIVEHFWLDENDQIDELEEMVKGGQHAEVAARLVLNQAKPALVGGDIS
jgi:hypothetical protein